MKQIKEREFTDNESGITSDRINQCTDVNELLNWKMIIESNIVSSQMKIDTIRGEQAKTGVYADPKVWTGINGYRRVLGFLSQKIQHRLRELHYSNKPKERTLEEWFCVEAKRILPEITYSEIRVAAKKLKIENETQLT